MITERLAALRKEMAKRNISIYVVPTADFHESEYVGEYFKARKFITGFTGSAGTAVITMEEAGLWTDGRYFVQAEKQLQGSTVTLYRMGEEGVPTVNEFIEQKLKEGGTIGFDGRVVNTRWGLQLKEIAKKKNGALYVSATDTKPLSRSSPSSFTQPGTPASGLSSAICLHSWDSVCSISNTANARWKTSLYCSSISMPKRWAKRS